MQLNPLRVFHGQITSTCINQVASDVFDKPNKPTMPEPIKHMFEDELTKFTIFAYSGYICPSHSADLYQCPCQHDLSSSSSSCHVACVLDGTRPVLLGLDLSR